jgi:hypothetical protein
VSGHGHPRDAEAQSELPVLDPRVHDALSDLYAHVLVLDAERQRVDARLAAGWDTGSSSERAVLERRRAELTDKLKLLRHEVDRLRGEADPDGTLL